MTEPTDAELLTEWDRVSHIADAGQRRLACLRAVLAKWGTPAPVEVEPVAIYHGRCTIDCGEHGHLDMELLKMIPAGSKLYTTPQPTQPQVGAVPLALHQRDSIKANAWRETPLHGYFDADEIIDAIEAAHGIK